MSGSIPPDPSDPTKKPGATKAPDAKPDDTGPLTSATRGMAAPPMSFADRMAQDRAEIDAKQPQMPVLQKPPASAPQTDPFQAFGQPAMWIAALGSLFTRRPFVNAINAAGAVLQSTSQKDAEAAKQHFETWKIETENGLKLVKFQQDAYNAAIKKMDVDAKAGKAQLETDILRFKDEALQHIMATHGIAGVEAALLDRKRHADAVASGQPALAKDLQCGMSISELLASDDPRKQIHGAVLQAERKRQIAFSVKGDPSAKTKADDDLEIAKAYEIKVNNPDPAISQQAWEEAKPRFSLTGNWKAPPAAGTTAGDKAAIEASLREQHPDWTPEKIVGAATEAMKPGGLTDDSAGALGYMAIVKGQSEQARLAGYSGPDREKIINKGVEQARAAGMDNEQISRAVFAAREQIAAATASGRTAGQRLTAIDIAANDAMTSFAAAKSAFEKLGAGQFRTLNQLHSLVRNNTNSPEQAAAEAADISAVTTFARALNPSGVGREGETDRLMQILNTRGQSLESHNAVLDQWQSEVERIKVATGKTQEEIVNRIRGQLGFNPIRLEQNQGGAALRPGHEDEDYNALPSGTVFTGPDGVRRVKP
jgi:hypothetical protein